MIGTLLLLTCALPVRATDPDTFSPVVSYQYYDSLAEPATTITSPVVSYQYFDTLEGAVDVTYQTSPQVSYQFQYPLSLSITPDKGTAFGTIQFGSTRDQTFTITNQSNSTISGTISVAAPFSIVGGNNYTLAPGQSQTVRVRFSPTSPGAYSAYLTFSNGVTWLITASASGNPTNTTGAITGIVTNSQTGAPINNAHITAFVNTNVIESPSGPNSLSGVIGGQAGSYTITGITPGNHYQVQAIADGFYGDYYPNQVQVVAGQTVNQVNIALTPLPPPPQLTDRDFPVVLVRGFGPNADWTEGEQNSEWGYWKSVRSALLGNNFSKIWDCNDPEDGILNSSGTTGHFINGEKSIQYNAGSLLHYIKAKALKYKADPKNNGNYPSQINIVAHSMGGLITRCVMGGRDHISFQDPTTLQPVTITVRRVIMLGTPNAGTVAADLLVNLFSPLTHIPGWSGAWSWDSAKDLKTQHIRHEFDPTFSSSVRLYLYEGTGGLWGTQWGVQLAAASVAMSDWNYFHTAISSPEQVNDGVVTRPSVSGTYYYRNLLLQMKSQSCFTASPVENRADTEVSGTPLFGLNHLDLLNDSATISWVIAKLAGTTQSQLTTLSKQSTAALTSTATVASTSNPLQLIAQTSTRVTSGASVQVSAVSDATTTLKFQLLANGADVAFRLVDPSGTPVDSTTPQSNPNVQYSSTVSENSILITYQITAPTAGTWQAIMNGSNISEPQIDCSLTVFGDSNVTLIPQTDPLFNQGQDVVVTCALADLSTSPPTPIQNASIAANVRLPDGTTTILNLIDDGLHNDGAPNDGVYASLLPGVSQAGHYSITYQATGQNNLNQSLQRVAIGAFSVSSNNGNLLGDPVFATVDTDGDGVADSLQAKCWVNPTVAGNYILSGQLVDASGALRIPTSEKFYANGSGPMTISLFFELAQIKAANASGDFHIENLQLFEVQSSGSAWLDAYHGTSTIQIGPKITAQPQGQTVTEAGQAVLSVTAQGGTFLKYQWQFKGVDISNAVNATLTLANVTPDQAGDYTVLITNDTGSATSVSATLSVTPAPIISLSGTLAFGSVPVNTSRTATLAISNTGHAALHVTSLAYPSGFSGNYSGTIAVGASQNVTVTFAPTSSIGYSGLITVNSDAVSGTPTIQVSGTGTLPTGSLQVTISPSGAVSAGAQWQVDGGALQNSGATVAGLSTGSHTVAFKTVSGWTTPGSQTVTVNANQTTAATGTYVATFIVTPTAGANGSISPNTVQTVNSGGSVGFTATPVTGYMVDQWLVNGGLAQTGSNGYTASNITANTTVKVTFKHITFSVTPSAGANGTINPNTVQTVNIGDGAAFTATPITGYMVDQWLVNGGLAQTGSNSYTAGNVTAATTVQVTFKPLPAVLAGSYYGLIQSAQPTNATSGSIALTLSPTRSFTAAIVYGGLKYSLKGLFTQEGMFSGLIPRKGLQSLPIELQQDGAGGITGMITDGPITANIVARLSPYSKINLVPLPLRGSYTVLMPPAPAHPEATAPQGTGYGTLTVDSTGLIRFAGVLGDGTKASLGASLSADGAWPFYLAPYQLGGSISGWITFRNVANVSDFDGTLNWFKLASSRDTLYPSGFTEQIQLIGSHYTSLPLGAPVLFANTNGKAKFTASGGNLSGTVNPVTLLLSNTNTVSLLSGGPFTMKLSGGLFTGTFADPAGGKARAFGGAVFQKQNLGAGLFIGNGQTGSVELEAAP